jgi:hypothetical protein
VDPELQKQINIRSARGWRPAPGESVVGTVAHIGKRESEYGTYPVVTLAADSEDDPEAVSYVAVNAFHSILKNQLFEIKPQVGDRIAVTYHGKIEPSKAGANPYHSYTVINPDAEVEDVAFDWNSDPAF